MPETGEHQLPADAKTIVVFDTNAYRELVGRADPEDAIRRTHELIELERAKSIQALAYSSVLLELLAHLADPNGKDYSIAKSAVVAAVHHCLLQLDSGELHPGIKANPDLQLCISLFHVWPKELVRADDLARAIAKRVADDSSEDALDQIRDDFRKIAELVQSSEADFATSMQQHLMRNVEVQAKALGVAATRKELLNELREFLKTDRAEYLVAEAHVMRAADAAKRFVPPGERTSMAKWVMERFPTTIRMYTQLVRSIAESDRDLSTGKGANYLWDMQVAFSVGKDHAIGNRPVIVISGDKEIVKAAKASGAGDRLKSFVEYKRMLLDK